MPVRFSSPAGLASPVPYHHVAVATGSTSVTVAGQVGGSTGDLGTQVAAALRQVAIALRGARAGFADVTRLTFYVTDWAPEKMGDFLDGIDLVRDELGIPDPLPPASLIGVQALFEPGVLVEIEATAVID